MMAEAMTQYHAQTPLDRETFLAVFEYRGMINEPVPCQILT